VRYQAAPRPDRGAHDSGKARVELGRRQPAMVASRRRGARSALTELDGFSGFATVSH
jgi:hypothetical protein